MSISVFRRTVIASCAFLVALWMFTFTPCQAQVTYGSIVGTVRDASGAVIVGSNITVTNVGTAIKVTQATNSVGAYAFTTLFPGTYVIHAEMQGFQTVDVRNLVLQVNQTLRTDITMQPGQVSQQVTVTGTLAALNTDTADVGEVIENQQVVDLPLNGRQFVQLATLANDVYLNPPNNSGDSAGNQIISEGGRLFSNTYLLDGVNITIQRGGSYGLSPSIDALGEFKLLQNTYSAEYGFGQTVLTASLKSGTNQFHGVAFDFLRNDSLDAVNAFNFTGKKEELRQNQFGGSFGGPIIKEKLFFFLNYEGQRTTAGQVSNLLNPTAAQLGGDLGPNSTAIDPTTGLPFPKNSSGDYVIPSDRISQFAKAALSLGAYATPGGLSASGYNLSAVTNETLHNDQGVARIDYYMSAKDHIDGFVSFNNYGDQTPGVNLYTGPLDWRKGYPIVGAEWAHTFSPTLLNSAHFGYSHQQPYEGQSATAASNLAASPTGFDVQSVNPDAFALAIPGIYISGYSGTGAPSWQPSGVMDTNMQYSDMVMMTRGHHILSMGGEFNNINNTDLGWATQNGEFDFNGDYTGTNGGAGDPLADFVLGIPDYAHAALKGSGDYPISLQWGAWAAFAQDDWRITPTLTLNLGLRWEVVQNDREVDNQFDNYDIASQTMLYAGSTMPSRILPTPMANFLPRLGAAWSPGFLKKTVIRGGFSLASGGTRGWEFDLQHFQPPYVDEDFLYNSFDPAHQNNPSFILPGAPYTTPTGQIAPYLLFPTPISTCCTGVDLLSAALYDLVEKKMPKYYEWNFNIQRELPGSFVLQVGYVGTHGFHLPMRYDINAATTPNTADNITPAQSRVPYPNVGYVCANSFEAYSNFNALNVHVERRFAGGKALTVAYSWARDLEVANQDENELFEGNDLRLNYGPYQMAQHLVANYLYQLPFGKGKQWLNNGNAVLSRIVGGWQFDGITTWQSGTYLTASSNQDTGMGGRAGNYADVVPGESPNSGSHTRDKWFNTGAFAVPPFPRYGTSHPGTIVGPGYVNFDLDLMKNIHFTESKYFQFRWEMFNAFNHVNLGNPDTNVSDGTFGVISSSNAARIMQIGMKMYF